MSSAVQAKPRTQPERILVLIEDNPADANLASMVHEETGHCSWLKIFHDPDEAISYLHQAERPVVIMTDLKLPRRTGFELIPEIRKLPNLETVPIVILTGSDNPTDLRDAYRCGANCVVKKPASWNEYVRVLERAFEFWCTVVALPKVG